MFLVPFNNYEYWILTKRFNRLGDIKFGKLYWPRLGIRVFWPTETDPVPNRSQKSDPYPLFTEVISGSGSVTLLFVCFMVVILDGNSGIGAHVKSEFCNLICLTLCYLLFKNDAGPKRVKAFVYSQILELLTGRLRNVFWVTTVCIHGEEADALLSKFVENSFKILMASEWCF